MTAVLRRTRASAVSGPRFGRHLGGVRNKIACCRSNGWRWVYLEVDTPPERGAPYEEVSGSAVLWRVYAEDRIAGSTRRRT
jgi:hypothetical protein